jgi:hypothetical protein
VGEGGSGGGRVGEWDGDEGAALTSGGGGQEREWDLV